MSGQALPIEVLSRRLCPWLDEAFQRIDRARAGGRLGHGWLIAGPPGVGKLNLAHVIARRLLDPEAGLPSPLTAEDAAAAMRDLRAGGDHHPDLHWVFPEAERRTIGIEQIREISRRLGLKSLGGGAKVVVIEPAEAMTPAAANALLKTLEEPTRETYLWLVSHQPGRLPPTIRSRCQVLPVGPPSADAGAAWLADHAALPQAELLRLLAMAGHGPLRLMTWFDSDFININKSLEDFFILISKEKADPQQLADEWSRADLDILLEWLIRRLQLAIRDRLAARASNPITDCRPDALHNAWRLLTLRGLFGQLQAAEKLAEQRGGGINADLALRVLLLGFQPNRE